MLELKQLDVQVQEERAHAVGMINYLNDRGGKVELRAIDKPVVEGTTPLEVFEHVLRHEEYVTSRINALADVAEEVRDRAAMHLLDWYIKEQVEEEANVLDVIKMLKMFGTGTPILYHIDKELAKRQYQPHTYKT